MNDQHRHQPPAAPTPPPPPPTAPKKPARSLSPQSLSGGLALILASISLIITAYLWYMAVEKQGLFDQDIVGKLEQLENATGSLERGAASNEQDIQLLQETQDTLRNAVDKLSADLGKSRTAWMLAEAEELMIIANHRLHLARNIRLALAALQAADGQLKQLTDPNLLPVRKILAEEISRLESLERVDIPGLALKIHGLVSMIDQLPLAQGMQFKRTEADPVAGTRSNNWRQFAREVWHDFFNLVRIRNSNETRKPLLPPEQQYFLRENLRLMLYGAQLAILERDEAVYKQNLNAARQWIGEYYDTNAQIVATVQNDIDKLTKVSVKSDLPDISASLQALRKAASKKKEQ